MSTTTVQYRLGKMKNEERGKYMQLKRQIAPPSHTTVTAVTVLKSMLMKRDKKCESGNWIHLAQM